MNNLQKMVEQFFLNLSLNHDCIADRKDGKVSFQGPSPDEVTLVDTAMHLGYEFVGPTNSGKTLEINGQKKEVEVLYFFEFSSKRKRASIVVRFGDKIMMLVKGADTIVIERLSQTVAQPYLKHTEKLLEKFSLRGLRTLVYATKVFSQSEWDGIAEKLGSFNSSPDKTKLIRALADEIEKEFTLIGCTAVEDKL